jgi:hypothetical protein
MAKQGEHSCHFVPPGSGNTIQCHRVTETDTKFFHTTMELCLTLYLSAGYCHVDMVLVVTNGRFFTV